MRRAAVLLSLLLLTGCTSEPADPLAENEPAFLDAVHAELRFREAPADSEMDEFHLKVGHVVCRELEAGRHTDVTAVAWAVEQYGEDAQDAAMTAPLTLCPDWYR